MHHRKKHHFRKRLKKHLKRAGKIIVHHLTFKGFVDRFTMIIASIQFSVWLPQIVKILQTKDVSGISPYSLLMILFLNAVWFVYGMVHHERPMLISCAGSSACVTVILISMALI